MLEAPPRHGKSEIVSRRFPAFALGRDPNLSMIATSYGLDLASRLNRDVQRIIMNERYREIFPGTELHGKNVVTVADGSYLRNSEIFEVVGHRGVYRCAGVGGGITGMGADILLIDDPVKDAAQAYSATFRDRVWDWYTSTAYTRLMPGGGVLLVMTRWHEDDLAGRILAESEKGGEQWEVVRYPAIAEAPEEHRNPGEALHPERYSITQLETIKKAVGSTVFGALYQQRPAPAEGAMFKRAWFNARWRRPGEPELEGLESKVIDPETFAFNKIGIVVDCSFKKTLDSDFVVAGVIGYAPPYRYVLDLVWEQMSFTETVRAISDLRTKWKRCREICIEDKANGPAVIEVLKRKFPAVIELNPMGGKEARAAAVTGDVEGGNFVLPASAPWVNDFISEVISFPRAAHDDTVDFLSYSLMRYSASSAAERFRKLVRTGKE